MSESKSQKLYLKVYNDLLTKIKNGEYKVGEKLPTEMELTKLYGVSRITISRAVKDLADINIVYRVKKSGTFVNGKLSFKNTHVIIPLILPFPEDFNEIARGVFLIGGSNNIFTPVYNTRNNEIRERDVLQTLLDNPPDGIMIYPCDSLNNLDLYSKLLARNIPIVCIDRNIEGIETPLVTSENARGMEQVVDYLVQHGHTRLGFFSLSDKMTVTERDRFTGFCMGLIKNNLLIRKEYLFESPDLHKKELKLTEPQQHMLLNKYVDQCIRNYFSLEEKPTAICCVNDQSAYSLRAEAIKQGIRVPEELTITGFDCLNISASQQARLLSVQQDFLTIGSTSIQLMMDIFNGRQGPLVHKVHTILVPSEEPDA